jgi:hypothetical protein
LRFPKTFAKTTNKQKPPTGRVSSKTTQLATQMRYYAILNISLFNNTKYS